MSPLSLLTRLARIDWRWNAFLCILSLLKAIGLRHDRVRFRRELLDAGRFLVIALVLRKVEGPHNRYRSAVGRLSRKKSTKTKKAKARAKAASIRRRLKREPEPETAFESLVRRFSDLS